jgi:FeS assembly protein IscX
MNSISKNKYNHLGWNDYKIIAKQLNKIHSEMDVMMLNRDNLIKLICDLPDFCAQDQKPDPYTLDDIRFEWFFLQKGSGEAPQLSRLRKSF